MKSVLGLLFEVSDKIPTVAFLYLSGFIWGGIVLVATLVNRWLGLSVLLFAVWTSAISISDNLGADIMDAVVAEMGSGYLTHWTASTYFSILVAILSFIAGLWSKTYLEKKLFRLN